MTTRVAWSGSRLRARRPGSVAVNTEPAASTAAQNVVVGQDTSCSAVEVPAGTVIACHAVKPAALTWS